MPGEMPAPTAVVILSDIDLGKDRLEGLHHALSSPVIAAELFSQIL
jgi:hypothetical protein